MQLGVRVTRPSVGMVRLSLCAYGLTQASPLASEGKTTPWKACCLGLLPWLMLWPALCGLPSTSVGPALCPSLDVFGQSPICPLSLPPAVCLALKRGFDGSFLELRGERWAVEAPRCQAPIPAFVSLGGAWVTTKTKSNKSTHPWALGRGGCQPV